MMLIRLFLIGCLLVPSSLSAQSLGTPNPHPNKNEIIKHLNVLFYGLLRISLHHAVCKGKPEVLKNARVVYDRAARRAVKARAVSVLQYKGAERSMVRALVRFSVRLRRTQMRVVEIAAEYGIPYTAHGSKEYRRRLPIIAKRWMSNHCATEKKTIPAIIKNMQAADAKIKALA